MFRRGGVEVGPRRVAPEFGFLITRTGHPLARRSEGGFPAQGGDEVVDRLHARGTGIHGSERRILGEKGPRMEVGVVEAGDDGPARQVEHAGRETDVGCDGVVVADRHKAPGGDGECGRARLRVVDRMDGGTAHDEIGGSGGESGGESARRECGAQSKGETHLTASPRGVKTR